jgi:hypothetical protein
VIFDVEYLPTSCYALLVKDNDMIYQIYGDIEEVKSSKVHYNFDYRLNGVYAVPSNKKEYRLTFDHQVFDTFLIPGIYHCSFYYTYGFNDTEKLVFLKSMEYIVNTINNNIHKISLDNSKVHIWSRFQKLDQIWANLDVEWDHLHTL